MAKKYGDIVYMRLGPYRDYLVNHPDAIREVLVAKAKHFHKMTWQRKVLAQWNGNSILLSEGDFWLRQRRMVQPAFHPRRLEQYARQMVACTERLLDEWENHGGHEVEITKAMTDLTIAIIAKTMFEADVTGSARVVGEAVAILSEVAIWEMMHPFRLPDWVPLPWQRRKRWAMRLLDETIRGIIRERRKNSGEDKGDLLSMLLLAIDSEGDGRGMTDQQARDEAMTLLLAGHDTTAAGLSWVWYLLARHPEVEARVRHELEEVVGERLPTAADVHRLKYTEMVIKETLRLYPPAVGVFARQAVSDVEIAGYLLKKGSIVHILSYLVHHDPRWFPDPDRFDPERFAPGNVEKLPQFAYFPFGGGPRVCIGNTFAMMEMTLIVATVLRRFHLDLAPGQADPELSVSMALRPKGGLRMVAKRQAPAELAGAR
jgi:cytochrome P450